MILKLKEYQTRKPLGPRPGAPGDDREGTEQDQNHCIDYGHQPESRWVPVRRRTGIGRTKSGLLYCMNENILALLYFPWAIDRMTIVDNNMYI